LAFYSHSIISKNKKEETMRRVLLLTIVLAFAFASSAAAADIAGTWAVKMKSPWGDDEAFHLSITSAGENLTITSNDHPKMTTLEGTGTLKGNVVTMSLKPTGGQIITFNFTGTVTGDKMSGTREIIDLSKTGQGAPPAGARGEAPPGEAGAPGDAASGAESGAASSAESGADSGATSGAAGVAPEEVSNVFTAEKI